MQYGTNARTYALNVGTSWIKVLDADDTRSILEIDTDDSSGHLRISVGYPDDATDAERENGAIRINSGDEYEYFAWTPRVAPIGPVWVKSSTGTKRVSLYVDSPLVTVQP